MIDPPRPFKAHRKKGPVGYPKGKERIDWTPEMLYAIKFARRTLKLPVHQAADYVGVSVKCFCAKLDKLEMPRRLKQYASRETRERFTKQTEK